MSEISEQVRVEVNSSTPRPPVEWKIAMLKDQSQTVTVVFPQSPVAEDTDAKREENKI